jgi:predicted amidohydrolase YtcJ
MKTWFALGALGLTAPLAGETLVDNVNGITLNAEGNVERFSAIVIGNDGRIKQVLRRGDKRPTKIDYRVDGKNRTMLPGLIDAHGHVMGTGWQALSLDLSEATSLQDALARVKAYAAANPNRRWIIGRGWNQERWSLGRFPTAQELDTIVPDKAVWLERVDGHAGWANSAAMNAAGITATAASPAGGKVEMIGGKPSGIFVDAAMALVEKSVPQPIGKERDSAFLKAQTALLAQGLTGIADMGTSIEDWMTFRRAGDVGNLRLRVYSYSAGLEPILSQAANRRLGFTIRAYAWWV